jgi:cytochrome d ubiquinol oxidase subunit I
MFHYLFPPLSIGLGALLVLLEGIYLRTGDKHYEAAARFFTRLFAANFAMGVATGIVMEFEFGTNWARYSRFVGDVFGSALAAEGIFAFFLESGFLAVLVFGWDRVSSRTHFFSTCMVALGATFSSVWIVVANSWQQTPAGFRIVGHGDGTRAEITDFWAMVFNPSSVPRLVHVLLGAYVLGAFFVLSITSYYLLKGRHREVATRAFRVALLLGLVASVAELGAGAWSAHGVAKNQPAKLAAFEAHFRTGAGGADYTLIGWPNVAAERVDYAVSVPKLLSLLVHQDPNVPVTGLDEVPREDWPPIVAPFITYRLMVGTGLLMVAILAGAAFLLRRRRPEEVPWLLKVLVVAVGLPYVANQAGWLSAEFGRQPWVVYGLLRTRDAWSTSVPASHVLFSTLGFGVVYALLFAVWVFVLHSKITHGPDEDGASQGDDSHAGGPAAPEGAAGAAIPSATGGALSEALGVAGVRVDKSEASIVLEAPGAPDHGDGSGGTGAVSSTSKRGGGEA